MPIFLGGSETFPGSLFCVFLSLHERGVIPCCVCHGIRCFLNLSSLPLGFLDAKAHVAKVGIGVGERLVGSG